MVTIRRSAPLKSQSPGYRSLASTVWKLVRRCATVWFLRWNSGSTILEGDARSEVRYEQSAERSGSRVIAAAVHGPGGQGGGRRKSVGRGDRCARPPRPSYRNPPCHRAAAPELVGGLRAVQCPRRREPRARRPSARNGWGT